MANLWVYFESLIGLHCGQHTVNNVLQKPSFTIASLAIIAQELDAIELNLMLGDGEINAETMAHSSNNCDENGNYSIQVLTIALQQHGLSLEIWNHHLDPTQENCFILNYDHYWFAIRKIRNRYWILDSTKDGPEVIGDFFLTAMLGGLIFNCNTVYTVRGPLPEEDLSVVGTGDGHWYLESNLLGNKKLEEAIAHL